MDNIRYWIWLSRLENVGSIKLQKLLDIYKTPSRIWDLKKEELLKVEGIGEKSVDEIINIKYRKNLDYIVRYMEENQIELIHISSKYYPEKLKDIYDKPMVLYVKGNKELLNKFSLAIIGCRENSEYGKIVAQKLSYDIAKKGIVTISGLARGIDSIAHKGTLYAKGKTIAVIGSSIDNLYPKENIRLANEIVKNEGLIVSEYVIGSQTKKMNFPARNRIISGLSNGVVVIEAKKKSGTMITVDFALEHGREVFAVPGNITSSNSEGTNELIKQGAKCITNVADILEEFTN